MPVSLAPAGRNIYSYGITKSGAPAERHGNEYAAPMGLLPWCVRCYKHAAPPELKSDGSAGSRTAALIQRQCPRAGGKGNTRTTRRVHLERGVQLSAAKHFRVSVVFVYHDHRDLL